MSQPTPVPALVGAPALPKKRKHFGLFSVAGEEGGTISEINTTPLIDVMLVLLIMFIITIPVASHKVPLDLPHPTPTPLPPRPFHQLDISANGGLFWNGAAVSVDLLQAHLLQLAADPATPELRLNPASEARYERVDQVIAQVRRAGVQQLGFIGNERYLRAF